MFFKYLSPLILDRNGFVFKIYRWISVFRRKKRFVNPLNVSQVTAILVIQENSCVFFKHPVVVDFVVVVVIVD